MDGGSLLMAWASLSLGLAIHDMEAQALPIYRDARTSPLRDGDDDGANAIDA
jgi:hypothetical protein